MVVNEMFERNVEGSDIDLTSVKITSFPADVRSRDVQNMNKAC
jgi:hypothetical protein